MTMGTLFAYSIYSSVLLTVLYLAYKWSMAGEKQTRFNRCAIWSIYITALCAMPAAGMSNSLTPQTPESGMIGIGQVSTLTITDHAATSDIWKILLYIYVAGITAVTTHTLLIIGHLLKIIRCGETYRTDDYRLIITDHTNLAPFSFMHTIIISRKDYESAGELIILHEKSHIRMQHCVDLTVAQIVCALQWFNPGAWLIREELKSIHEYQADEAVITSGADIKKYQMLLIKKAVGLRFPSLTNNLNHSKLKKRITMMYNQKSSTARRMRALVLVPSVAVALAVVNLPAIASAIESAEQSALTVSEGKVTNNPIAEQTAYTTDKVTTDKEVKAHPTVEQMPEYPGGIEALINDLSESIIYPDAAEKNGIEGRVVVQFVVNEIGEISNVEIKKSVSPELDEEAKRVVTHCLAKFTPGRISGKDVSFTYTLPITFKLKKSHK